MEIYRSNAFANQIKTLLKSNWEVFQEQLCDTVEQDPPKLNEIMSEVGDFKIVKRRFANPLEGKGKSQGFRVWYCISHSQIILCKIISVSSKEKEKPKSASLAEISKMMKPFLS